MDTSDPDIQFDDRGFCNHCKRYFHRMENEVKTGEEGKIALTKMVDNIRKDGEKKAYDCILGVSGGIDSTYLAYKAKELKLRPLIVHFDNGWDSEIAVKNIQELVNRMNFHLYTFVIDWEVFRDIQKAFLKSSYINSDIPADHAILSVLFNEAAKRNISYVLYGSNIKTEGIIAPAWVYGDYDWRLIKHIVKKYGNGRLKGYPHMSLFTMFYYVFIKRITYVPLLNYINYDRSKALETIQEKLGWREYGSKHFESIFTKFYQGYILPEKYNVDKRKAHLSTLVLSGEMSRERALEELKKGPYNKTTIDMEKEYFLKKMQVKEEEFNEMMTTPPRPLDSFPNLSFIFHRNSWFMRTFKPLVMKKKGR